VLVNNVGACAPEHWSDVDPETWRRVIETNVTATYLTCRRAVPAMREAGWGGSSTSATRAARRD
jgi:3-oxoacyl-[acyl-carrier protein] reductase